MDKQPLVIVDGVSKTFRLPHEQSSGIKQLVINTLKGKRGYEEQKVLSDVSFEINRGDFFGIVGRNGSGKSTLLKLIAEIYIPDSGTVQVNGSLTPFIELGVGFNPELTGRENVHLNGALLGFSKTEMEEMYDDIVEFAELELFMDQKLKNYSSGMQVRLAFSIAIRAKSDILLIDEVLAVGDSAFQQKCFDYFDQVKRDKKTIIFVSHDMEAVKRYCNRAVYVSKGKITKIGTAKEIATVYDRDNNESISKHIQKSDTAEPLEIRTLSDDGKVKKLFEYNDTLTIDLRWNSDDFDVEVKNAGIAIYKGDQHIYGANTIDQDIELDGNLPFEVELNLGPGKYKIVAGLFGGTRSDAVTFNSNGPEFVINKPTKEDKELDWDGVTKLKARWNK